MNERHDAVRSRRTLLSPRIKGGWPADFSVVPDRCGEGEQPGGDAGLDAGEGLAAVVFEGELPFGVSKIVRDRAGTHASCRWPAADRMRTAQPCPASRKGKSDPIDAHLAVLAALRLDANRLPVPRADGDREALRILLVAGQEITVACTAQTNRLRALLLAGDDADRQAARAALSVRAASRPPNPPPRMTT